MKHFHIQKRMNRFSCSSICKKICDAIFLWKWSTNPPGFGFGKSRLPLISLPHYYHPWSPQWSHAKYAYIIIFILIIILIHHPHYPHAARWSYQCELPEPWSSKSIIINHTFERELVKWSYYPCKARIFLFWSWKQARRMGDQMKGALSSSWPSSMLSDHI